MKVEGTYNYGQFKVLEGNRDVNEKFLVRLEKSIKEKNLLRYNPILVNEKMEVVDGQHRLAVAKKNSLEIFFTVVADGSVDDMILLDTNVRAWGALDYLESWIKQGKDDYKILKDFMEVYDLSLTIAKNLLAGLSSSKGGSGDNRRNAFRDGYFTVTHAAEAQKIAELVQKLQPYAESKLKNQQDFISALVNLNRDERFDVENLIKKLKTFGFKLKKQISVRAYLREIEDIYNFKTQGDHKVDLSAYKSRKGGEEDVATIS